MIIHNNLIARNVLIISECFKMISLSTNYSNIRSTRKFEYQKVVFVSALYCLHTGERNQYGINTIYFGLTSDL